MPRLISPTWCPARPTRCRPLATDGGDSTWITRSTAPMSIPSSSELVATTHRNRPDFNSSSIWARCSLLTDPWWARANTGASSGIAGVLAVVRAAGPPPGFWWLWVSSASNPSWRAYNSLSAAVTRSASRREFAKTMVARFARISFAMARSMAGQIDPAVGDRASSPGSGSISSSVLAPIFAMSSTGTSMRNSKVFTAGGWTIRAGADPPRNAATASGGRTVADRPIRWAGRASRASSRSRDNARWVPRLVPATACTSSTMTVSTSVRVLRAALVSIR